MSNGPSPLGYNSDVAFVTTNTNATGTTVVNAVGGHGMTWNNNSSFYTDIFGYPGNLSNGQLMYACSGTAGDRLLLIYHLETISGCNFGKGSSGGPWLKNYNNSTGQGYVNSVTSNGPDDNSYINGPYFDSRMSTLFADSNNDW